jgi:hypothetical protein
MIQVGVWYGAVRCDAVVVVKYDAIVCRESPSFKPFPLQSCRGCNIPSCYIDQCKLIIRGLG